MKKINITDELLERRRRALARHNVYEDEVLHKLLVAYGLNVEHLDYVLTYKNRHKDIFVALRHLLIYSVYYRRVNLKLTLKEIAALFFLNDHSSVLHCKDKMQDFIRIYPDYKELFKSLKLN